MKVKNAMEGVQNHFKEGISNFESDDLLNVVLDPLNLILEEAPSAKYIQVSETNIQQISEPNHLLSRTSDGSGGIVKEKRLS